MPYLRRYSPTKLCYGAQMAIFGDFFASCISSEPVQDVSHLHPKFALRPPYGSSSSSTVDIQSATAEIGRGKKIARKKEGKKKPQDENIMSTSARARRP